ncbi:FMN reductase [Roseibium aquae]|uniref:FMN reductase n=1 Tax=Roseibium aquae TaxID=1323746 RepID=A0A916X1V8_9HYPH|nr:NAD(P)H-dependent oxidoreductase [Roseibium aquae]GGB48105.1 FMN reductase [Roseibium aquae]
MRNPNILVFSGSVRSGSFNGKLAALVAKKLALADATVTHISLKDYPLPLYDGDLERETGVPASAQQLKRLMVAQDGVFIACPEYNAGVTPLLKNAIDWVSRLNNPGEPPSVAFKNRVFTIGAASPGAFGGMRGLIGMRTILEVGLGAHVLPQMVSVPHAASAFTDKGDLTDERADTQAEALVKALIRQTKLGHRE